MFERFTDRARRVLVLAQEEARLLDHGFVGTEHILLGLIHEGEGVAAQALESLGISLEAAREKVRETIGATTQQPTTSGRPPFTPRAKKVLELSLREALQLGHDHVGTEHLLLGIVREGEGVGAQVLVSLGADLGQVRQQVIKLMTGRAEPGLTEPSDRPIDHVLASPRQVIEGRPHPDRCSLCGKDLWETARFVVGAHGRACEECVRAASGMLGDAASDDRELVLPPRVSGQPTTHDAVQGIVTAISAAFGPTAGPTAWATTVEEPEQFEPLLQRLLERWGRPETVQVTEVGFITPQLAFVRFDVRFDGSRGTSVSGQLRRHEERWAVTADTLTAVLRRAGIDITPPDDPAPGPAS